MEGNVHEGHYVNDLAEGYGTILYRNKDRFEGQFKLGTKTGKGTYYFHNGDILTGEWLEDKKIEGEVYTIQYSNGDSYEGGLTTEDNLKEGRGRLKSGNGCEYVGLWK